MEEYYGNYKDNTELLEPLSLEYSYDDNLNYEITKLQSKLFKGTFNSQQLEIMNKFADLLLQINNKINDHIKKQ